MNTVNDKFGRNDDCTSMIYYQWWKGLFLIMNNLSPILWHVLTSGPLRIQCELNTNINVSNTNSCT
jgi:hypothetical protein